MRTSVLLIEDGHAGRSVLAQLFGLGGLTVYAFASVKEAASHLEAGIFDVALLDGDLPHEEGVLAAQNLASRFPTMHVVVMMRDQDSMRVMQQRCPRVVVALKTNISEGVIEKVGVGSPALCNN